MSETLAIYGGKPAVDVSKVVNWPPINEIDEKMVLEALHAPSQARGPQNLAFDIFSFNISYISDLFGCV